MCRQRLGALGAFESGLQIELRLRQLFFARRFDIWRLAANTIQQGLFPDGALQPLRAGRCVARFDLVTSGQYIGREAEFLQQELAQADGALHLCNGRRRVRKIARQCHPDALGVDRLDARVRRLRAQGVGLEDGAVGLDQEMVGDARLALLHLGACDQIGRHVACRDGVMHDQALDGAPGAHGVAHGGAAQQEQMDIVPGGPQRRAGCRPPFVGRVFDRRRAVGVERRGRTARQAGNAIGDANRTLLVVHAQMAKCLPTSGVSYLKQASAQNVGIAAELIVVPVERFPIRLFTDAVGRIEPADIAALQNFVHARQARFGDDDAMAVVVARANITHDGAVEQGGGRDARPRFQCRPAIFVKTEIAMRFESAREPVEIVLGGDVVASAKVERHRFDAGRLQACVHGRLKQIERPAAPLKELGKLRVAIQRCAELIILERCRAGQRLVESHPGVNQQAPIDLFAGVAKIVFQDAVGVGDARARRVARIKPAHLLVQGDEQAANDERVGREAGANFAQQPTVASMKEDDRRLDERQCLAHERHGAVFDVESEFVHGSSTVRS